ncbi:MAG: hypothetical protein IJ053_00630, partial [Lachnospiraceae bacterium]|nr:hypothetical protein [Lachnospiraceae bacterium]
MQQSYAGKDISRFIAAICWLILGIVYIANIFSMSDSIKAIKAYKSYGSYYRDLYNKTMTLYVVVIGIYIAAALIAIMAMVYLIQESLAKFAKAMYCFGLGYIIVVVLALIYIVALADGNIGSVFSAFSYMGSSVTKYLMVFAVMLVLIIASIFVHGNNYIKADRGVTVGYKCFLPLVLYLATFICLGIISAMLKSDFGGYVDVSDVFGSTLKS